MSISRLMDFSKLQIFREKVISPRLTLRNSQIRTVLTARQLIYKKQLNVSVRFPISIRNNFQKFQHYQLGKSMQKLIKNSQNKKGRKYYLNLLSLFTQLPKKLMMPNIKLPKQKYYKLLIIFHQIKYVQGQISLPSFYCQTIDAYSLLRFTNNQFILDRQQFIALFKKSYHQRQLNLSSNSIEHKFSTKKNCQKLKSSKINTQCSTSDLFAQQDNLQCKDISTTYQQIVNNNSKNILKNNGGNIYSHKIFSRK